MYKNTTFINNVHINSIINRKFTILNIFTTSNVDRTQKHFLFKKKNDSMESYTVIFYVAQIIPYTKTYRTHTLCLENFAVIVEERLKLLNYKGVQINTKVG